MYDVLELKVNNFPQLFQKMKLDISLQTLDKLGMSDVKPMFSLDAIPEILPAIVLAYNDCPKVNYSYKI